MIQPIDFSRSMPAYVGCLSAWRNCFSVVLVVVAAAGCESDGLPGMTPIRGSVTYDGEPLTHGTVLYLPTDKAGRQARGEIQPDGRFVLTTLRSGDGALPGEYAIVVLALQPHPGEDRAAIEAAGGMIERGHVIPERYTKRDTSGLSDTVNKNHSGTKEIVLVD